MSSGRLHFPAKLYQIIESESPDIIRWHQNGKSFRIFDHAKFESYIIPKYFRHSQISSVQRQLNLYGFKCVSRGEHKGSFFHPKFIRGEYDAVRMIRRSVVTKSKKNSEDDFDESIEDKPSSSSSSSSSAKTAKTADIVVPPVVKDLVLPTVVAVPVSAPAATHDTFFEPTTFMPYQDTLMPMSFVTAPLITQSQMDAAWSQQQQQPQLWTTTTITHPAYMHPHIATTSSSSIATTMIPRPASLSQRLGFVVGPQYHQQQLGGGCTHGGREQHHQFAFLASPPTSSAAATATDAIALEEGGSPCATPRQMTRPCSSDDLLDFLGTLDDISCNDLNFPDMFDYYDGGIKIE